MPELQKKVGMWNPPDPDRLLTESLRGDRPFNILRLQPEPCAVGPAEERSIRILPEHFGNPALFDSLRARRGQVLVAEGDSWFDFPIPTRLDLLDALDALGRPTASLAYRGDTLENMVYGTQGSDGSIKGSDLGRLVTMVREIRPRAVLLSAGGNDVAGEEFRAFLNHRSSGLPRLRESFLREITHEYMKTAYLRVANAVWDVDSTTVLVVHGYANAKPTGLGIGRVFGLNLIGPWLKPALDGAGYGFDEGSEIVRTVLGEFNAMLAQLGQDDDRIVYVDFRPHVGDPIEDWSDELHLNNEAVKRAAVVLNGALTNRLG